MYAPLCKNYMYIYITIYSSVRLSSSSSVVEGAQVHHFEERLAEAKKRNLLLTSHRSLKDEGTGKVWIFINGAFDMMQYGHMNAFWL